MTDRQTGVIARQRGTDRQTGVIAGQTSVIAGKRGPIDRLVL